MSKPKIDEKKIIEAALEEFAQYSFDEASLNRIIKRSGISKGSFYYRFNKKYDLYLHLLKTGNERKWHFIRNELKGREETEENADIFSLFLKQAELGIHFAQSHPGYHKLGKMFSREKGSPVYNKALIDLGLERADELRATVDAAMSRGEIDERFSREFILKVLGYLFRSYDEIFSSDNGDTPEQMLMNMSGFVSFMKFGLAKQP